MGLAAISMRNIATRCNRSVKFCNRITARLAVWLAGVLVPAQTMPVMACGCGNQPHRLTKVQSASADAAPLATCPRFAGSSAVRHPCCARVAARSADRTCCAGKASCSCCQGGSRSQGTSCQCSKSGSAPAPAPLSNNSRTDNTKSSSPSLCHAPAVIAVVVAPGATAHANQHPFLFGSSAPERLSVLCRLVI